ncbi:MAG: hypothetical protein V2A66_07860 [Pseudomonadota bacterium]
MSAPKVCPVDRYNIDELAAGPHKLSSGLAKDQIAKILRDEVNLSTDKVPKEYKDSYKPEDSISAFEAYGFVTKLVRSGGLKGKTPEAAVGDGLLKLFFGGSLEKIPEARDVLVTKCHDGDTCTITETQGDGCNLKPVNMSVRISGIDAPEVGPYTEKLADTVRNRSSYPYGKPPSAAGPHAPGSEAATGWINSKLVENVDKIHARLSEGEWDPAKISYKERAALNSVIATTISFTGQIATLPAMDLLIWRKNGAGAAAGVARMMESQIRWTSDDTPAILCGLWQPYDIYGRRLGSFLLKQDGQQGGIASYIGTRLPELMAQEGARRYNAYREAVARPLELLSKSGNKGLKKAAAQFSAQIADGRMDPGKIYSKDKCGEMAKAFGRLSSGTGHRADDDIQAMQILIGSAYDYMKYRNAMGDDYLKAGVLSREGQFGFWKEVTFTTLWETNRKLERYHPKDCMPALFPGSPISSHR